MDVSFEAMWRTVEPTMERYCRRSFGNPADAEELYQRVMIRAWRGHASFRGDSAYATWVVRIAAREASRLQAQIWARRRRETVLHDRHEEPVAPARDENQRPELGWLGHAVEQAATDGVLTRAEAEVVRLRLACPTAGWETIAEKIGSARTACAVLHCRAVPKLRVFLFVKHQAVLGGAAAVEKAFRSATENSVHPLGPAEVEVFRAVVLEGRDDYRRRGWQADLRAACAAVIHHLDVPVGGTSTEDEHHGSAA